MQAIENDIKSIKEVTLEQLHVGIDLLRIEITKMKEMVGGQDVTLLQLHQFMKEIREMKGGNLDAVAMESVVTLAQENLKKNRKRLKQFQKEKTSDSVDEGEEEEEVVKDEVHEGVVTNAPSSPTWETIFTTDQVEETEETDKQEKEQGTKKYLRKRKRRN
mgnify:CR=1 FL=1